MKIGLYTCIKETNVKILPRLVAMLVILFSFLSSPSLKAEMDQNAADRYVSLRLNGVGIPYCLSVLEKKANCVINYNKSVFSEKATVSIDVENLELREVLKKVLAGTRVAFKFTDAETVLLYKLADPQKPGRISGKVVDEKGEPLPGASVRIIEANTGVQSGVDGAFTINVNPGTYTVEITYISYLKQRVTGVQVAEDKNTALNVAMKPDSRGLKEVVVTVNYRRASAEGLLARQKNASEISNGISAEQIAQTPDKNIGESLKRISGTTTFDNRYIIVRGIGERYNSAMLDGTVLPSTEAQSRNFSFDLIPSNMVDNVVVSKTSTPDMNASFGGGLIQINTRDIPEENFASFTAGVSYNDQTVGKDFLSHKRGKYDFLGFDDGRRKFPDQLVATDNADPQTILAQSKRFVNDNFSVYTNPATPSQNYQFVLGRLFSLDTTNSRKWGFTASLSYRNTQSINAIEQQGRGSWAIEANNAGNSYGFNTTWGGLFNAGLQLGKHRFSLRNTYTHLYDNALIRITGYSADRGPATGLPPTRIQDADDPIFTDLLQNKLGGQHQLGKFKLDWDIALTSVSRKEKDLSISEMRPIEVGSGYAYFPVTGSASEVRILPTSRHNYDNSERNYSWNVSASVPVVLGALRSTIKTGYFGLQKHGEFNWTIAPLVRGNNTDPTFAYLPIAEQSDPDNMTADGINYRIEALHMDGYEGKSSNHAGYLMLDQRLYEKLRLVWGLRGEYYRYKELKNGKNVPFGVYSTKPDARWQWLPSANLTYSPLPPINLRLAYSSSAVRPELMDNSQFWRYSPYFGDMYGNQGLYSTRINSWDARAEWFPGAGEIISAGVFYKKFDKPAELSVADQSGTRVYYLKSSHWAKVYGLELELRKNFSFLGDASVWDALFLSGNLTLQTSDVKAYYAVSNPTPGGPDIDVPTEQERPMYGQTPYLINGGLQYVGDKLGFSLMYNRSGYKTYMVSMILEMIEFERPREQIDAQLSYRFFKNRLQVRVNAANLLNRPSVFYSNRGSYEPNPDYRAGIDDPSKAQRLKPGFTEKFEEGDFVLFKQRFGRTYSTSLTYNF